MVTNTVGFILIGVAALITAAIFNFAQTPAPRFGPDQAGIELFYLMVCPVRWLVLAAMLGIVVQRGGFTWISGAPAVQWTAVYSFLAISGVLSICSLMGARTDNWAYQNGAWIFGYLAPAVLMAYAAAVFLTGGSPIWARALIGLFAIVTLAGSLVGARIYLADQQETEARRRSSAEEERAVEQKEQAVQATARSARLTELQALPPTVGVLDLLNFFEDHDSAVIDEAGRRILALPKLNEELGALLQTKDRHRGYAFMWRRMQQPPKELAQPFHESLTTLPQWVEGEFQTIDDKSATKVASAIEAIVILATRFPEPRPDFRPSIERTKTLMEQKYNVADFRGYGLLKFWLEENAKK